MSLYTTIRRFTTNLKTKYKNFQKIELYGSLDNQEFKEEIFIQTSRRGADGEPGIRGCSVVVVMHQWRQLVEWEFPHSRVVDKN